MPNEMIKTLVNAKRETLENIIAQRIRSEFNAVVASCGPTLRGAYNHPAHAKIMRETLERLLERSGNSFNDPTSLNETKLLLLAREIAETTLSEVITKLVGKVGELENPSAEGLDGMSFVITGTRNGSKVRIEQSIIVNVSSRGKVFNQFPARIYVNGKAVGEAAYKRG